MANISTGKESLPPNAFIWSAPSKRAANSLLNGSLFTRLVISSSIDPAKLQNALVNGQSHGVDASFYVCHRDVALIFDIKSEDQDLQDAHHEHFRSICLALKDQNITLNVAACVFDALNLLQAGFQMERLNSGSILMIDIMNAADESEDEEDLLHG